MSGLLDTGFLLAVLDADDEMHKSCSEALFAEPNPILPDVVLPELAYMVLSELGYSVLTKFLASLQKSELAIEHFNPGDLKRTAEILSKYQDNKVDFVDCAIVAIAERLNIFASYQINNFPLFCSIIAVLNIATSRSAPGY
ncbi:MAG TPA: PIN domain-containing protein [bacterium]